MSTDIDDDDPFGPWVPVFKVWHRKGNYPKDAIYVGRPTKWGNPVHLDNEYDREEVLLDYEKWLMKQPELVKAVKEELKGHHLVCWCAPKRCHADILLRVANEV